ncbi:MAG: DNA internalization-related competence protein ComEC/Rec2 [Gammaproteobacteria bacterium]|nr:DNA internalization-related competence protein ComEC/Rec2 [Gammaproteobacteria bacterium]
MRGRAATATFAAIAGCIWCAWTVADIRGRVLPEKLEGQTITLGATVVERPSSDPASTRFLVNVTELKGAARGWSLPARVRLRWYDATQLIAVGDSWQFTVRLKRPRGVKNPGAFDYEAWMFGRRISATGYVVNAFPPTYLGPGPSRYGIQRFRANTARFIESTLDGHAAAGLIVALAVGHRHAVTNSDWQILRSTGTAHLMAISGLHIGLVSGMVYWLASQLWRRCGQAPLHWPASCTGAVSGLAAAIGYAALSGLSVPTQRAVVMVAVVVAAMLLRRRCRVRDAISVAMFVVLVLDPLVVTTAGFWLSFGAVALIGAVLARRHRIVAVRDANFGSDADRTRVNPSRRVLESVRLRLQRAAIVQLSLVFGLAPLSLYTFGEMSVVSPLANAVAIPIVGFIVVPLSLLGVGAFAIGAQPGAKILFHIAVEVLDLVWRGLSDLAAWSLAAWTQPTLPDWVLAVGVLGVVLWLLPRGVPVRWLAAVAVALLLVWPVPRPPWGGVWVSVLDVGQGLAVVAQTRQRVLVFDTGPRFRSGLSMGHLALVPFLRNQGIRRIDRLVVSHDDNDHIGGIDALREAFPIDEIFANRPESLPGATPCHRGQNWMWQGVHFEFLHPQAPNPLSGNDASCVLRVSSSHGSVLIPGDIEAGAELALVGHYGPNLASDVLVVPHHGSRTSSTGLFLGAVRPRTALISAGYRNRYGHPHTDVLSRYRQAQIEVYSTSDSGALFIHLDGRGDAIGEQRHLSPRIGYQSDR